MIRDLADLSPSEPLRYDVAIVGAGAAGITLALELENSGLRVAVLEGGGRKFSLKSQNRYKGDLTVGPGLEYPDLDVWRLRYLGGTTNHWGGHCRPLDTNVFMPRPGVTDLAWPWPRKVLNPYYVRAHEICELGDPQYEADVLCERAGVPLPFEQTDTLAAKVWRFSPPTRFGTLYRKALEGGKVDVMLDANCVGFETSGTRVTAVNAVTSDKQSFRVAADQFVLAAGGIENVRQLLLLARDGVSALDRSGLLGVGFTEHPHFAAGLVMVPTEFTAKDGRLSAMTGRIDDSDGTPFRVGLGLQDAALLEHRLHNMSYTLETMSSDDALPALTGGVRELWSAAAPGKYSLLRLFARTEQRFNPESRVRLTSQSDDLGLPRAGLDWRITDTDRTDALTALRLIGAELMRQGFGPMFAGELPDDPMITGGAHHLGGARLHESPDQGVVDPDLRCHALKNLAVVGGSVFPTACFSNPTLTIVALAIRLARSLEENA